MTGTITAAGAHIDTPFDKTIPKADVEKVAAQMREAGAKNVKVNPDPTTGGWILSADWILPPS
jgi:hypothetical protein